MATLSTDALAQQNAQDSGWLSRNSDWLVPAAVGLGGAYAWHRFSPNTRLHKVGDQMARLRPTVDKVARAENKFYASAVERDASAAATARAEARLGDLWNDYYSAASRLPLGSPSPDSVAPALRRSAVSGKADEIRSALNATLDEWEMAGVRLPTGRKWDEMNLAANRLARREFRTAFDDAGKKAVAIDRINNEYYSRLFRDRVMAGSSFGEGLRRYADAARRSDLAARSAASAEEAFRELLASPGTVEAVERYYRLMRAEHRLLAGGQVTSQMRNLRLPTGMLPPTSTPYSGSGTAAETPSNPYADRLSTPYKFMTDWAGPLLVPGYGGREGSWMKAHPVKRGLMKLGVLGGLGALGYAKMKQSSDQEAAVKAAQFFEMAGQTAAFDAMTNSVAVASSLQPGHFQTAFDAGDADGVARATEALRNGLVSGFALGGDYETAASNAAMRVLSDDRFAYYLGRNVLSSMSAADRSALEFPDGASVDSLPGDAVRDFGRRFFVDDALSRAAELREQAARDADAAARYRKSEPKSGGAK